MADGQSGPSTRTQEVGTLWIQDHNGVAQMVRVVHATPTKPVTVSRASSSVVRAIVRKTSPAQLAAAVPAVTVIRPQTPHHQANVSKPTWHQAGPSSIVTRSDSRAVQGVARPAASSHQQPVKPHCPAPATILVTSPLVRSGTTGAKVAPEAGQSRTVGPAQSGTQQVVRVARPASQQPGSCSAVPASVRLIQVQPGGVVGSREPHTSDQGSRTSGRLSPAVAPPRVSEEPPPQPTVAVTPSGRRLLAKGPAIESPRTPEFSSSAGKRPAADRSQTWSTETKRSRTYDRSSKGLRLFSMRVCQKVREKGITTYNEVADELVDELCPPGPASATTEPGSPDQQYYEQKNIRRRVYDALNVLMAMEIISKQRKQITWHGLPGCTVPDQRANAVDGASSTAERADRTRRIREKTQQLKDLLLRQIAFKNLVDRNLSMEEEHGSPEPGSTVHLPFIVVSTSKRTVIDCSISQDKMEYLFNFDDTFEIHDDVEVLKRMGMTLGLENGTCTQRDVQRAKSMVSAELAPYIDELALEGSPAAGEGEGRSSSQVTAATGAVKQETLDAEADPMLSEMADHAFGLDWLENVL